MISTINSRHTERHKQAASTQTSTVHYVDPLTSYFIIEKSTQLIQSFSIK